MNAQARLFPKDAKDLKERSAEYMVSHPHDDRAGRLIGKRVFCGDQWNGHMSEEILNFIDDTLTEPFATISAGRTRNWRYIWPAPEAS